MNDTHLTVSVSRAWIWVISLNDRPMQDQKRTEPKANSKPMKWMRDKHCQMDMINLFLTMNGLVQGAVE